MSILVAPLPTKVAPEDNISSTPKTIDTKKKSALPTFIDQLKNSLPAYKRKSLSDQNIKVSSLNPAKRPASSTTSKPPSPKLTHFMSDHPAHLQS